VRVRSFFSCSSNSIRLFRLNPRKRKYYIEFLFEIATLSLLASLDIDRHKQIWIDSYGRQTVY
jgi:hypothetical protein